MNTLLYPISYVNSTMSFKLTTIENRNDFKQVTTIQRNPSIKGTEVEALKMLTMSKQNQNCYAQWCTDDDNNNITKMQFTE